MKGSKGDKERIAHILEAISSIKDFTKGLTEKEFLSNDLIRSGVERKLEIIGEAVAAMSDDLKNKYPETPWQKIKSFRNFIAHEYFGVSYKLLWRVITDDLPVLEKEIINVNKNL